MKRRRRTLPPGVADIRAAREAAGLSKTDAAALVHTTYRVWQQWERGDCAMHPAFFELFQLKSAAGRADDRDSE